jgi:hypothetical protein
MKKILSTVVLTLAATTLGAQSAKPTEVNVRQVNDRRTNGHFSALHITLELPKYHYGDITASRVIIATATDDTGRDLVEKSSSEPTLDPTGGGMMARDPEMAARPASVSFDLKNPERKAKSVKEVRGEIELYMPSKDPNSTAEVAKFMSLSGKTLSNKALSANNIEIAMISPAQIDVEKKKLGEAKRKEAKDAGMSGDDVESYVKDYLENVLKPDEGDVIVRIKDPEKRIQEISYVDAGGEAKHVSMHEDKGFTILSTWGGAPQADWKLRVSMKTSKNLVRNSFVLTNVALP